MPALRRAFTPDPRLKSRQRACGKPECQRERHRENCAAWNDAHRDQFRDRHPQTRTWLERHPGYLAWYRRSRPEVAEEHRRVERERLRRRRGAELDIQDSIWRYLFVPIGLNACLRWLDIQDSMAPPLARALNVDRACVSRTLRLIQLSPDIIEAILRGDEPSGLSLNRLSGHLPVVWSEQRRVLGFR